MEFGARRGRPIFTRRELEARWARHLENLEVQAKLKDRICDLPVESQQGVEIARALVADAKLLILDEPTAVLSPNGVEALFQRLRNLKTSGVTILLVLHKIREVLAVADSVTVLRGGRLVKGPVGVGSVSARELSAAIIGAEAEQSLTTRDEEAVVGSDLPAEARALATAKPNAPAILAADRVSTRPDPEGLALGEVSLAIAPGEIVGVAGVEGNGQRTLVRALTGLAEIESGGIQLNDQDVAGLSTGERRARGLRVIPFERNSEGLSLSSSLWENWPARQLLRGSALKLISPVRFRAECDSALKRWDVRYSSTLQPAGSLSGGNAQKLILAREVDPEAKLVIAAQPTRGLDVGATAFVWKSLRDATAEMRRIADFFRS